MHECVKNYVISFEKVKKSANHLKPASQRSVGPIIAKLASISGEMEKSAIPNKESAEEIIPKLASKSLPAPKTRNAAKKRKPGISRDAEVS